ncbi:MULTISPECIES: hypothetical protein [unclassified Janthinobacterium]|jgi:uncharacterized secreted protein with C-terminal beta-propeller domain|uniref:hypothetical protein n=1 Tax=unclassified Janthinobacterium TaxID=2610881 RepID=UPI0002F377F4|nr:hypothetical protein [Janthinobacterium sp. CG_23.4]MCL6482603.1 hypothetical protein [Janthinobacterium lividum]MDH6159127.1 putative secreted protein with C-terminal beta-propeller domain [Janthinobacterium sp. CG_23.4]
MLEMLKGFPDLVLYTVTYTLNQPAQAIPPAPQNKPKVRDGLKIAGYCAFYRIVKKIVFGGAGL